MGMESPSQERCVGRDDLVSSRTSSITVSACVRHHRSSRQREAERLLRKSQQARAQRRTYEESVDRAGREAACGCNYPRRVLPPSHRQSTAAFLLYHTKTKRQTRRKPNASPCRSQRMTVTWLRDEP